MDSKQHDASRIDSAYMDLFVAIKFGLHDGKAARKITNDIMAECWSQMVPGDYEGFIRAVKSRVRAERRKSGLLPV